MGKNLQVQEQDANSECKPHKQNKSLVCYTGLDLQTKTGAPCVVPRPPPCFSFSTLYFREIFGLNFLLHFSFLVFASFFPNSFSYGVSAQYRFRCVLGELGRFREKTGSGKVPGTVPGTVREPVPMGSEVRIGSRARGSRNRFQGSEVWIGSKVPRFFPNSRMLWGLCTI